MFTISKSAMFSLRSLVVLLVCALTILANKDITKNLGYKNLSSEGELLRFHNATAKDIYWTNITRDTPNGRASIWLDRKIIGRKIDLDYLRQSSILFGLTQIINEGISTSICYQHMRKIATATLEKNIWAIKAIDSSGSKIPGFLWGQNYWLGSKEACEAVQRPVRLTLSDQFERSMKKGLINDVAPFEMNYLVIYVRHNSPWQVEIKFMSERIIHIGLCLPKSCSTQEILNITQSYLNFGLYEEGNIFDIQPEVIHIKDLKPKYNIWERKSIKFVAVYLIFSAVMLFAALFQKVVKNNVKNTPIDSTESDFNKSMKMASSKTLATAVFYSLIKCFDVLTNLELLFRRSIASSTSVPVINGLRSICCIWIMIFHVMWYMYFTVDNKAFLISHGEKAWYQYVSTAPLLVDVFFTISGFLLAYNFLRNQGTIQEIRDNNLVQNIKVFGKELLHRYLRLAPLYLVLVGVVESFTAYIQDVSVFHIHERYDITCSRYWWRNILFIQNFFHQDELCLNWTWSLACEMQFFFLGTVILIFYAKNPEKAKEIFTVTFIGSTCWSYLVMFRSHYQLSFDVIYHTGTQIYINPFIRIMPYLIGMATGWLISTKSDQIRISKMTEKCLWNIAITLFFSCIFSTIRRDMSMFKAATLYVIGRLSFSLSIAWMIYGSATSRGVWWSRFLEWQGFQHLNKLSYAIYLLNPFIIAMFFSLSNSSTHADPVLLTVLTFGFVVIVYLCAIIFSILFEIPYYNISRLLLSRKIKTG